MSVVEFLLAGTLAAALPLILAALGEMVVEKTGLLNLGLEGMMALGAAIAFICVYETGSHILGFVAAAFASALLAMVFAGLVLGVKANEVATGLGLGVLGLG
ncbi:MAG: ABC transporter permease, partial [Octadecabacter sp.]